MSTTKPPVSRREFLAATAATGIAAGVGQGVAADPQAPAAAVKPENALPKSEPTIYKGTAAAAVVAQLRAAGVRTLFHTNTSGFTPFWEAIYTAGDVQVINMTHEGQAVAAAAGYTMASRNLGFFFGSHVGLPNALSNTYNAWKDRVPLLLAFSGGQGGNGEDSFESWDNTLGPMEPFTTWTGHLEAEEVTDTLRRAIKFAFGPPSGPVALTFGANGEQVQAPIHAIDLATMRARSRAPADVIEKVAQWLVEADNPLFVIGSQVGIEGAQAAVLALAEKLSVPVAETMHSLYANFPNDHPLFVGELQAQRYPRKQDLLISFGESFTAGREDDRGLTGGPTRRLVHISHDPQALGRSFVPDISILSDLRSAIRDLSAAVDAMLTKDRMARIRSNRLAEVSALTASLKESRDIALRAHFDNSPITWERIGFELEKALDKDAVIVPELGTQYYKMYRQLKLGGDNKQRIGRTKGDALGWGMAAAFGVNLALADRQIVALQGDGGFLFNQSETLWSIARYEAPMLIVIMNNHTYNESRARNMLNGGTFYEAGKDFNGYLGDPNVEFTKIAEAYGLRGEKVTRAADLAPALQRCLRSMRDGKAVVLDVDVAVDGAPISQPTWYQRHSIAEIRKKRLNG
ncbi:MAG TPA: thiamine pyrophosphate-dependent enzyme [Vicinamibacterales bacterium]|nr:thiamine pyrophosphate-dependent enzyme [Vicinamibacterales bacterium]